MNVRSFYGSKKRVSRSWLNEIIDTLNGRSFTSADVFISPPADDSDGDSEDSDVEPVTDRNSFADHLSHKILAAPAEASVRGTVDCSRRVAKKGSVTLKPSTNRSASKKRKVPISQAQVSVAETPPRLHLTTSKVMVIVWRLRGNIILTVLYWQRATSSMGTVNRNSSHSPVGPRVCLCVFWVA